VIVEAIARLLAKRDLGRDEMALVIGEIMDGQATPAQIGGLLVGLRAKGETVDELVGAAMAMRARAAALPIAGETIDTCGTGGDGSGTVNISTLAAIIIAACGGIVVKHGNYALSSKCGSADVLLGLGILVDSEPAVVARCVERAGIGFALAPRFHAATRHAAGPRRELKTRTIFNLLGPLTNPAHVRHQVVGVYDRAWCEPMARALGALGVRRAAVVHGDGKLDELAVRGETHVALWDGTLQTVTLTPASFGRDELDPAGLAGGQIEHNVAVLRVVLAGDQIAAGEPYEAVLVAAAMTAALGLELLEETFDLARLPAQQERAEAAIRDGRARDVLTRWRDAIHWGNQ